MKIIAVVVTYNRLELLKECIEALRCQTVVLDTILVINNGSTDGTSDWLNQQTDLTVIYQENIGGSGGFSRGIKEGCKKRYDWIWVMDDDTIVTSNALEELLKLTNISNDKEVGFIASKVLWKDSTPNIPSLPLFSNKIVDNKYTFNYFEEENCLIIQASTFLSMLINSKVVEKVGLPYKEFFIWWDDIEYSERITENGFLGLYANKSKVYHKTSTNQLETIMSVPAKSLWKFRYGLRNELFLRKKRNPWDYIKCCIKTFLTCPFRIIKNSKEDKIKRILVVYSAIFSSLLFNPKINYINK